MNSYRYRTRVAWAETDAAQVAHFSNYFRYFERAEQELYNDLDVNPFNVTGGPRIWYPRVEAHCSYFSPCRLNDSIEVELTLSQMKEKSMRYDFTVRNLTSGKDAAKGYAVIVSADSAKAQSVPLPKEFAGGLIKYFGLEQDAAHKLS
jgi:acyl-CoA thioester hydrolase